MVQKDPDLIRADILLVEDNRLVGEITLSRLRQVFRRVDWAETGPEGLALWAANRYDLILVDQLLPGMNGSELVRRIRDADQKTWIIGVTASTMGTECRALERAGANRVFEKPFSFAQIRALAAELFP